MLETRTKLALSLAAYAFCGCGARTELDAPAFQQDGGAACPSVANDVDLTVGRGRACALLPSGTVACWGADYSGTETCPLAKTTIPCSTTPVVVSGLSGVVSVRTSGPITCAVLASGNVECWGFNTSGALGIGTTKGPETCGAPGAFCSTTPVDVPGVSGVTAVALGQHHVCALLSDGTVMCWGDNTLGELGIGTADGPEVCGSGPVGNDYHYGCSTKPVAVPGLNDVIALTAGTDHTCALLGDGHVACWGANYSGQIGSGSGNGPDPWYTCNEGMYCSTKPFVVKDLDGVTAITAGNDHTCALRDDGTVRCWGAKDFSELGNGVHHDTDGCQLEYCTTKPVDVQNLSGVRAIAAGGAFTCALLCDGTVSCWGYNGSGSLGLGNHTGPATCHEENAYAGPCSPTPVAVPGLNGVTAIAAGSGGESPGPIMAGGTVCAVVAGTTIECWGDNEFGTLGIGTSTGPEQCADGLSSQSPAAGSCATTPVVVSGL